MKRTLLLAIVAILSATALAQSDNSAGADDLKQLRDLVTAQQKQLEQQQKELEKLQRRLDDASAPRVVAAKAVDVPRTTEVVTDSAAPQDADKPKESPLSFRIGGAEFTPGGFADFTTVFRTTATGNGIGTNFFSIPFNNAAAGQMSELNFSAENSRLSLKATDSFKGNDVTGYVELDLHGNDAANLNVSSNSSTERLRLYWVDVKRGKFEFLAGQTWSFLTPNRVGVSPMPSDVFYSQNMDLNYQVGLTWTRAPEVRFIYHPDKHWAMGVALENPDQFLGQSGQVLLPNAFSGVASQLDAATAANRPNTMPDFIPKVTYDTDLGGRHFHLEGAGLVTRVRVVPSLAIGKQSATGGGVSGAMNLEVFKNFRLVANAFVSDGGGRYIFGSGPQTIIRPDGTPSLVHADSGIAGFEWQATKKSLFAAYFGGDYFHRDIFLDTSAGAKPNTLIGYGTPGNTAANRAIQEGTLDWIQTFWKSPQYGALQLITEYSYLTRAPWSVSATPTTVLPKNARLGMAFIDIRYVLP